MAFGSPEGNPSSLPWCCALPRRPINSFRRPTAYIKSGRP